MTELADWAARHGISHAAMQDLQAVLRSPIPDVNSNASGSEASAQQRIRLAAPYHGVTLWRNNNGACTDENGNHVRYGLANDSSAMNKKIKSHDLIGITELTVMPYHVGSQLGIFTSIECKRPGWQYKGTPREVAQLKWANLIKSLGGISQFATDPAELW